MIKRVLKKIRNLLVKKDTKIIAIPQIVDRDNSLSGRVVLVTGGTSGIGLAIAHAVIRNGGKVIVCGSSQGKLEAALQELGNENAKGLQWDITNYSNMNDMLQQAIGIIPNQRIDTLVNCAGLTTKGNFFSTTEEEYDRIMNLNVKSVWLLCRTFSQYWIDNKVKGHILNISSSSALKPAWGPYQMSKWAVRGLTIGLAEELSPYGITVNAIGPGKTATPMMGADNDNIVCEAQPSKRFVTTDEVANLALFLIGDTGNMIMGDTVYITGGTGLF